MTGDEHNLRQALPGWQIFFIVASTIIGEGIFSGDGAALATSGPGGALLSLFIISIIVICVMECVSEFVQLFPCPNAIVAYIETFVDKELALVCGLAYWYTWASIFASLNLLAANFTRYWGLPVLWQVVGFYIIAPIILLGINLCGVWLFGLIESIGGILKITLVVGTGILMYVLSSREHGGSDDAPLYDGFEVDHDVAATPAAAVCWNLPLIAYSFLGHESVAVTAFEARTSRSLKLPSRSIAYFIFIIYTFTLIGEFLMVDWEDYRLTPNTYGRPGSDSTRELIPNSNNMAVIATFDLSLFALSGFLNACYIFSVLSGSNSALYVASRTLYGLTRGLEEDNVLKRQLKKLSKVDRRTGVPARAMFVSVVMFFWLPFLHLRESYPVATLLEVLQTTSSVSCLIVWATLCLAYIRYLLWLRKCKKSLQQEQFSRFDRGGAQYKAWTLLAVIQPVPACIGLVGSLLVVFVFTTASWWHNRDELGHKIAVAYAAPIIIIGIWVLLKLAILFREGTVQWWVKTSDDFRDLHHALKTLIWLKNDEVEGPSERALSTSAPVLEMEELSERDDSSSAIRDR